jgi:hypothetical protein
MLDVSLFINSSFLLFQSYQVVFWELLIVIGVLVYLYNKGNILKLFRNYPLFPVEAEAKPAHKQDHQPKVAKKMADPILSPTQSPLRVPSPSSPMDVASSPRYPDELAVH